MTRVPSQMLRPVRTTTVSFSPTKPFAGKLECAWFNSTIGSSPDATNNCEFNAIWTNGRGMGAESEPRLTLCDYNDAEENFSNLAIRIATIPSVEKLKSFTTVDQFVELLGNQRGFSDGYGHNWQVFSLSLIHI